jgi:hypothetical protein
MASKRLHLSFPHGAPAWARWGRRVRIGEQHYRVGRANEGEAVLWLERATPSEPETTTK